jgi:hypothetical protein
VKRAFIGLTVFFIMVITAAGGFSATAKPGTLTCVGLYSETGAGSISYRVGTGEWIVIKVGDEIPANAEIRINVDRDWIEVIPAGKPTSVYEITGSESGDVIKKVPDILKGKPTRTVAFPVSKGGKADPKYKDKLVVSQYLGRQIYRANPETPDKDIKYGDVLDIKGKVTIIAINNTINLMNDKGAVTTVIGPLKFEVEKVLTNQNLYKFLNVAD